jgi:radical SAM protein
VKDFLETGAEEIGTGSEFIDFSEIPKSISHQQKLVRSPAYDVNLRPFITIWESTFACDLACKHCRANSEIFRSLEELQEEEAKELLNQIKDFGFPPPIFIITGGDPFKRDDIFSIAEYGKLIGIPVSFSPSVTPLFTDDKIELMKKVGVKAVSLSLDGPDEKTHDEFRGVDGVFRRTIDIWEKLKKAGIKVQINTTVTQLNKEKIADIFEIVAKMNPMTWSLFFLVKVGRAEDKLQILPQEYEDVMNFLFDAAEFVHCKTTEGHHYKRIFIQRTKSENEYREKIKLGPLYFQLKEKLDFIVKKLDLKKRPRRTPMNVNAGKGFIFISKKGEVFPSGFLPMRVGNVREENIVNIYRESEVLQKLRDTKNLKGKCGICEFKEVCGGSRSRAFSYTGDPFESEPFCIWQPSLT